MAEPHRGDEPGAPSSGRHAAGDLPSSDEGLRGDFVGSDEFRRHVLARNRSRSVDLNFECPAQEGLAPRQKVNLVSEPEDVRVRGEP